MFSGFRKNCVTFRGCASGARFFRSGDVTLWWAEDGECGSVGSHDILENGDRAKLARVHRTLRVQ